MALMPGLPTIPFLALGGGLGAISWQKRQKREASAAVSTDIAGKPAKENVEALLQVDPLSVEVGLGLVRLVDGGINSSLLQRIAGIRKNLASQLGYYLPPVKVNDNLSLRSREYSIVLKGVEIARYELPLRQDRVEPFGAFLCVVAHHLGKFRILFDLILEHRMAMLHEVCDWME